MAATLLTMSAALAPGQDDFLSLLKPSLSEGFQEDSSLFSFEAKNPDTERGLSNDYSQVNCFISSLKGAQEDMTVSMDELKIICIVCERWAIEMMQHAARLQSHQHHAP